MSAIEVDGVRVSPVTPTTSDARGIAAEHFPSTAGSLDNWIGTDDVAGYAVVLAETSADGATTTVGFFRNAVAAPVMFQLAISDENKAQSARPILEKVLRIPPTKTFDKGFKLPEWKLFRDDGITPVNSLGDLAGETSGDKPSGSVLLFFLGGRFIWPAIRVGFRREIHFRQRKWELVTLSTRFDGRHGHRRHNSCRRVGLIRVRVCTSSYPGRSSLPSRTFFRRTSAFMFRQASAASRAFDATRRDTSHFLTDRFLGNCDPFHA